jgi:hypothetical protein
LRFAFCGAFFARVAFPKNLAEEQLAFEALASGSFPITINMPDPSS